MRKEMATQTSQIRKAYVLDGTLLEVCSCKAPCPCWIGEDPDDGRCDAVTAYHIEQGQINGIEVSGFSLVNVVQVPGNVLAGNWRAVIYLDDRASEEQRQALLDAFCGKLGGPLVSLASLVGEHIAMIPAPIEQKVEEGKGTLRVGNVVKAEMSPYTDGQGRVTALHDTAFSTIAGSPAYVARAQHNWVALPEYSMTWEYSGRNAIQGHFHFEAYKKEEGRQDENHTDCACGRRDKSAIRSAFAAWANDPLLACFADPRSLECGAVRRHHRPYCGD